VAYVRVHKSGSDTSYRVRLLWALPGDQELVARLYGGDRSSGSGEAPLPEGNASSSEGSINLERRALQLSTQAHIQFRDPRDRPPQLS